MNRVLITGGAGFVGSNLARHLANLGIDVVVCDNFSRHGTQFAERLFASQKNIYLVRGELEDIGSVFLKHGPFDVVYHFAAQVAVTHSYHHPFSDFRINALGTFHVVRAAGDTPVIYASTNKVYGNNVNNIPLRETKTRYDFANDPYQGVGIGESFSVDTNYHTPYGCSKLTGELYVREFGGIANRFSCMYGPNQFGNEDQGWVAHFVISKVLGRPGIIYGDGKQVRDLLFIDDVVSLLVEQGTHRERLRGEVFSIGGGYANTISLIELCTMLDIPVSYQDWRPADQKVYYADISKATKSLNWRPRTSIVDGISRLMGWAESHKDQLR